MSENVDFINDIADVVRKHYPDAKMPVTDIAVYFGAVIAGALASYPEPVRDRAARVLAKLIRYPDMALKRFGK